MSEKSNCAAVDCKNEAHLQCPTCIKLNKTEGSFFCSQDCFKKSWVKIKVLCIHSLICHKREFTRQITVITEVN